MAYSPGPVAKIEQLLLPARHGGGMIKSWRYTVSCIMYHITYILYHNSMYYILYYTRYDQKLVYARYERSPSHRAESGPIQERALRGDRRGAAGSQLAGRISSEKGSFLRRRGASDTLDYIYTYIIILYTIYYIYYTNTTYTNTTYTNTTYTNTYTNTTYTNTNILILIY
jgi:hypothetical protein